MNYKQIQEAVIKGQSLTAVFDGTKYYEDGDEYPLLSYPPHRIISTGGLNHWYFDEQNDGKPDGVKFVCRTSESPYNKALQGFTRTEVFEFHAQGVLPSHLLEGLEGNGLSYAWRGHHIVGWEKIESVYVSETERYQVVKHGVFEKYATSNPKNLTFFELVHPYIWYVDYKNKSHFIHHKNPEYQGVSKRLLLATPARANAEVV